jgi:hypothetical protein
VLVAEAAPFPAERRFKRRLFKASAWSINICRALSIPDEPLLGVVPIVRRAKVAAQERLPVDVFAAIHHPVERWDRMTYGKNSLLLERLRGELPARFDPTRF